MSQIALLALRGLAFGFIVVAVSEVASRSPRLGSLILTLPIVIPVVFLMMYFRDGDVGRISWMSQETLRLIPLGLPFFVPLALAPRLNMSFWPAFLAGLLLVTITISAYLWLCDQPRGMQGPSARLFDQPALPPIPTETKQIKNGQ